MVFNRKRWRRKGYFLGTFFATTAIASAILAVALYPSWHYLVFSFSGVFNLDMLVVVIRTLKQDTQEASRLEKELSGHYKGK